MTSTTPVIVAGAHTSSPQGVAAIDAAARETRLRDGRLVLVGHVGVSRSEYSPERHHAEMADRLREVEALAERLADDHGIAVSSQVPDGALTAADSILRVAASEQADLVVIGVRDRSRVGKLVLGSDAQAILLDATCPVLAVRAQESRPTD